MELLRTLAGIRTPLGESLMGLVTQLGEQTFFLLTALIILWCLDKKWGFRIAMMGLAGSGLNQLLKAIFLIPRPWVIDPEFPIVEKARAAATGYSFPSGHTQGISVLAGGIALWQKRAVWWAAMVGVSLLVLFSRMYLGVHTPLDVGVGFLLGWAEVLLCGWLFSLGEKNPRVSYAALWAGLALCLLPLLYVLFVPAGARNILEFDDHGKKSCYSIIGAYLGVMLAWWLDRRKTHFPTKAVWWAQILKCVLGLGLALVVLNLTKAPLRLLFRGNLIADGVRYFLTALFGAGLWPMTFRFWSGAKVKQIQ